MTMLAWSSADANGNAITVTAAQAATAISTAFTAPPVGPGEF